MEHANSTPSIADSIASQIDDDNSTLPIENTETTETPDSETSDVATTDNQTPEVEENFTVFNPNNLTPEMLTVYKKWQADYTQKRQSEKAEYNSLKEKLAQYEQSQGTHQEKVQDFNIAKNNGEIDPNMSFQDYSRLLIDKAKEELKADMSIEQQNEYLGNQETEFQNLDPRFPDGPAQDKILLNHINSELSALRDLYEQDHNGNIVGFDFIGETKKLIADYDNRFQQSNKDFINKQNNLIKGNSLNSKKANPNARNINTSTNGNMSLSEGISKAFENI